MQRVANATEVVVVQHPAERRHPIGSVRFLQLGLERCRVAIADADESGALRAALAIPQGAALLYPLASARELPTLPPRERPRALVVLDGTWTSVRRLLAGDARLSALPAVRLSPDAPGRYRIRRAPRPEYLSTLEAVVGALRILEPERTAGWDGLLAAFAAMIDEQIAIMNEAALG